MATLLGASFTVDAAEVHTYIISFTAGISIAEAKMKPHVAEKKVDLTTRL